MLDTALHVFQEHILLSLSGDALPMEVLPLQRLLIVVKVGLGLGKLTSICLYFLSLTNETVGFLI